MTQEQDQNSALQMARDAFARQDAAGASQWYMKALESINSESPYYPECLERLVFIYKMSGDLQTAGQFCYELVRSGEEHLGKTHPQVVKWRSEFMEICKAQGSLTDAPIVSPSGDYSAVAAESASEFGSFETIQEEGFEAPVPDYKAEKLTGVDLMNAVQASRSAFKHTEAVVEQTEKLTEEVAEEQRVTSSRAPQSSLKTAELNLSNTSSVQKVLEQTQILAKPSILVGYVVTGVSILYALIVSLLLVYHTYSPFFIPEVKFAFFKPSEAADSLKTFRYISNKTAEYSANNKSQQIPYRTFGLGFDEFVASLTPTLWRREFWVQDNGLYIRDEDDTVFVAEHSPESIILEEMKKLGKACQAHFEEHHQYPETVTELDESELRYMNPYTGRKDLPLLQLRTAEQPDREKANAFINNILKEMASGRKYNDEPAVYPGCINGCVLTVQSPDKIDRVLIIHGCTSTGQFFSNSGYKRTYLIAHRNGEDLRYVDKVDPLGRSIFWVTPGLEFRPSYMCVLKSPGECFIPLKLFRYRGILGFFVITLGYLLLLKFSQPNTKTKRFNEIMVLVSLAAVLLSFLNAVVP